MEWGPSYSWEYHDWVLMCSAFHVRKMVTFPYPLSEFLHLKDPNIFFFSPSQLGCFFVGSVARLAFFFCEVVETACRMKMSLFDANTTVNVWNEVSWANFVPPGQRNQIPCVRLLPSEPARLNLVTTQSSGRPLLSANRSPVAKRGLQLVTCA